MIGLCTDSSSQLSAELRERYSVEVVPLTVSVGDLEYLDGVDIAPDELYALLTGTAENDGSPVVVSEPSAGQYAAAYEDLLERGCTEILSVHSNAVECNTTSVARMAARSVPVPVRLAQVATEGFGVSCCVWGAGEAIGAGASLDEAVAAIDVIVDGITHVHSTTCATGPTGGTGFAVMAGPAHDAHPLGCWPGIDETAASMAARVLRSGTRLRVGVGMAGGVAVALADALATSLTSAGVVDLVRYRLGAGCGVQMRLDGVSCFAFPLA